MNKFFLITTFDEEQENIKVIANQLIESRLPSCINLIPNILSIFNLDGKVTSSNEVAMCIKTYGVHIDEIKKIVKKLHEYSTPEFIVLDFGIVDKQFDDWYKKQIKD